MKSRFIQVFTVCLVTLIVLSPGIVVFSIIWEQHLELVLPSESRFLKETGILEHHQCQQESRNSYSDSYHTQLVTRHTNFYLQKYKNVRILQLFFLLFPIFIGVFIFLYDRYLIYRTAIFQQQVEMLERLWQQNIE